MNVFQFAEAHPWWTLIYLIVVAEAFQGLIKISFGRRSKP